MHAPAAFRRRQLSAAPTASGILDTGVTESIASATATTLAIDTKATSFSYTVALAGTYTPEMTATTTSASAVSSEASSTASAASSGGSKSLSTIVGACIGAFVGVLLLVFLALWWYNRQVKQTFNDRRNVLREAERGRSRNETWGKLDDKDESNNPQTKEVALDHVQPMEKLTMFKKSTPSTRTAYTQGPEEPPYDAPFSQYHPGIVKELVSSPSAAGKHFVGSGGLSWTEGNGSVASLKETNIGRMSPILHKAIPTPPVSQYEPPRWESAEVVHMDTQPLEVPASVSSYSVDTTPASNQIDFAVQDRHDTGVSNPFFNAQENSISRAGFVAHSRVTSVASVATIVPLDKGKAPAVDSEPLPEPASNPFEDPPRPSFSHHTPSSSHERAIMSLINALDVKVSPEDVQERLRVASMATTVHVRPDSATTGDSIYSDFDLTESFPVPP
ncbi:hypothetical protein FISHEDRAFT_62234 [Fistulina hepatica ATCC 64428]|nr:hypothetical protein FISHEDRAFT_62234 [Fistulina hepatica ATCC 64428]